MTAENMARNVHGPLRMGPVRGAIPCGSGINPHLTVCLLPILYV